MPFWPRLPTLSNPPHCTAMRSPSPPTILHCTAVFFSHYRCAHARSTTSTSHSRHPIRHAYTPTTATTLYKSIKNRQKIFLNIGGKNIALHGGRRDKHSCAVQLVSSKKYSAFPVFTQNRLLASLSYAELSFPRLPTI